MKARYTHSPLEFYKLAPTVKDPVFATEGSACFDLHAWIPAGSEIKIYSSWGDVRWQKVPETGIIQLSRSDRALIPVGLIFDIPEGWSVRLHSRSGMALKSGLTLANHEGIIDSDYMVTESVRQKWSCQISMIYQKS
jgi:dUTPase